MGVSDRCVMTWEKAKLRWRKMYKGKVYTISCEQLGVPATKEASYQLANEWWRKRLAELDPHPHAGAMEMLDTWIDWAKAHGIPEEAAALADTKEMLREDREGELQSLMFVTPTEAVRHVWNDRLSRHQAAPPDRTLRALSQRFLKLVETRVTGGELSASEYDLVCRCLGHALDFFGASNEPSVIDADRWEAYWSHLRQMVTDKKRSLEYSKKDFRYARAFIEWMDSMGKMTAPKNLHYRRYRFGGTGRAIETFDVEEVRKMVEGATGQLKLHFYLMLNCGFYQSDISDLHHDEVDLEKGYITRQRSKTRQHHGDKVPTVTYKLWPVTLELFKAHRSEHPVLALTTRQGKPWVEEHVEGNRVKSRRDGIKSNFAHLAKRLKITKPLKSFRKTSSSMLDNKPEFARYAQFFLGQSGRSVAEKHYVKPSQEQFDAAVDWLRQQYGF